MKGFKPVRRTNTQDKFIFDRSTIIWLLILFLIIVLLIVKFTYLYRINAAKSEEAVRVVASQATVKNVPIYLNALGNVTPTYTTTVKSQINGVLLKVHFKEGQYVKAGALLAEIDCRPYQAQLVQYQGQLARDQALLANALIDLKRYQTLWKQDSISQQTLATQTSLVKQYQAAIELDKGQIETVKVNISYCAIYSPIDGRVGLRLVDPGNVIQTANNTGIVIVNMLNPITVVFSIAEDDIPEVLRVVNGNKALLAKAYNRDESQLLATGKLLTIDNQIDPATGTVKLKAVFENPGNVLFPSQFVNIKLLVNTLINATVVPTAAIQYDSEGTYVYIVRGDRAKVQKVIIGVTEGDQTTISQGVQPGDSVVTEGTDRLTDNTKIALASPHVEKMRLALITLYHHFC